MTETDGPAGGFPALLAAFLIGAAVGILGMIQAQTAGPRAAERPGPPDAATAGAPDAPVRGDPEEVVARVEAALAGLRRSTADACRLAADPPSASPGIPEAGADRTLPAAAERPSAPPEGPDAQTFAVAARPSRTAPSGDFAPEKRPPASLDTRNGGPMATRPHATASRFRDAARPAGKPRCPRWGGPGRPPTAPSAS